MKNFHKTFLKSKSILLPAFLIFGSVNAQQIVNDPGQHSIDIPQVLKSHAPKNRAIVSDWYNYGRMIYDMGGTVPYYRNFLFPDSTVQVEFSSGYGYVWKHSIGHVLDPTSVTFDITGQVSAGPGTPYTLDSIAIPYRYWRPQTGAPDTLVIQIYKETDITLQPTPGWTSGASYATVDYDYLNRIGMNESQTITYLLKATDEINATQGVLQLFVGMPVAGGGKVAATVTYLPGNPYSVNDTIDTYGTVTPTNLINAFVMYDYNDQDMNVEPYYYNNELSATTEVRYNTSTIGWNGNYIPGTAWLSGIYSGDIYFKLTFDTAITGMVEDDDFSDMRIYPNPASELINIINKTAITAAVVYDVTGNIVSSINGTNITSIDLSSIAPGMYVLKLTSQDGLTVEKQFIRK